MDPELRPDGTSPPGVFFAEFPMPTLPLDYIPSDLSDRELEPRVVGVSDRSGRPEMWYGVPMAPTARLRIDQNNERYCQLALNRAGWAVH
jgi:hypothetical protein